MEDFFLFSARFSDKYNQEYNQDFERKHKKKKNRLLPILFFVKIIQGCRHTLLTQGKNYPASYMHYIYQDHPRQCGENRSTSSYVRIVTRSDGKVKSFFLTLIEFFLFLLVWLTAFLFPLTTLLGRSLSLQSLSYNNLRVFSDLLFLTRKLLLERL